MKTMRVKGWDLEVDEWVRLESRIDMWVMDYWARLQGGAQVHVRNLGKLGGIGYRDG